jgi:peroxiredoxin
VFRDGLLGLLLLAVPLVAACRSPADLPEDIPVGTQAGMRAPALTGIQANGETFRLEPAGSEPTLLVFYRSALCGLCRVQLEQLQSHMGAYDRRGVKVVAATLDPPELSARLLENGGLDFPLVSVDSASFDEWAAMHPESGAPLPATYIIDARGIVRYLHIGRNASDRATDAGLLTVLERLDLR